jgi:aminoglycoside phosphotransferase (APT) family kinase protein
MRENWMRAEEALSLTNNELEILVQPAFPRTRVLHSQLAAGGLANTNIRVMLYDRKTPVMVRIFTRDPSQAQKEFRINSAIDGAVPTPEFFHFSMENPVTGHPYAIMQWLDAPRLETVYPKLSHTELMQVGTSIGKVLANIHHYKFPTTGMLDNKLKVSTPIDTGSAGMLAFAEECLIEKNGGALIGEELTEQVFDFIRKHGPLLDTWKGEPCLTHSDFGGSNILVHDVGSGWEVAAVLDWEFAFSGTPFFDFGNLLRKPLGSVEGFAETIAAAYCENGGELPPNWRRLIRLTDLSAWFDFLARPHVSTQLIADAKAVIADTISLFEEG